MMKRQFTPLGDVHNGRQTCLIQSETDTYIVKPRSSKTEEAFDLFCQKAAELGFGVFARAPRILQKGENEHTQCVEYNEITDENGADLYYQRAGVLLFFTYLLGSNDLHCENLIAAGDMPVLVDLETLLTGKPRGMGRRYTLSQSVMRSHLLCNFMRCETGIVDVSGFCGVTAQWKNIPHTAKGRVHLWNKRDIFIESFEKAYRFTMEHKNEVAQWIGLFERCTFRQLLRPTKTYTMIADALSKIEGDKEAYATALLSRAYERDVDKNRLEKVQAVLRSEVDAVLAKEIPLFYSYGNDTALYCNNRKVLDGHLELSPVAYALSRLQALSSADLARQSKIIALAVDASAPLAETTPSVHIHTGHLCAGERTAQTVTACAVDGLSSMFCGLQSDKNGNVDFVSHKYSLYQGLSGVLCMYAALFRKTEKTEYKERLERGYEQLWRVFCADSSTITLTDANASLADGVVGAISCMEHIGRLIEDETAVNDARAVAQRLRLSERLTLTDYLNGIGALPLVWKRLGMEIPASIVSLFMQATPFTTGVGHGSSGIALSLGACRTESLQETVDEKIHSVLQWENRHYSAEHRNWFDLRDVSKKGFMSGWCSGAPGIGMARKYVKECTADAQLQNLCDADIENVKTFLSERTACKKDTLCCGTSSVLMAASVLEVPVDAMYARLCRAEENNEVNVTHIVNTNDRNVSLMQGASGIAYTLAMYGDPLCGGMLL